MSKSSFIKKSIVAAGGNSAEARRLRVKEQRRDRYGRWVEMGGAISFPLHDANGILRHVIGHAIGGDPDNANNVLVMIKGHPHFDDGVYSIASHLVENIEAELSQGALDAAGVRMDVHGNTIGNIPLAQIPNVADLVRRDITPDDEKAATGRLTPTETRLVDEARSVAPAHAPVNVRDGSVSGEPTAPHSPHVTRLPNERVHGQDGAPSSPLSSVAEPRRIGSLPESTIIDGNNRRIVKTVEDALGRPLTADEKIYVTHGLMLSGDEDRVNAAGEALRRAVGADISAQIDEHRANSISRFRKNSNVSRIPSQVVAPNGNIVDINRLNADGTPVYTPNGNLIRDVAEHNRRKSWLAAERGARRDGSTLVTPTNPGSTDNPNYADPVASTPDGDNSPLPTPSDASTVVAPSHAGRLALHPAFSNVRQNQLSAAQKKIFKNLVDAREAALDRMKALATVNGPTNNANQRDYYKHYQKAVALTQVLNSFVGDVESGRNSDSNYSFGRGILSRRKNHYITKIDKNADGTVNSVESIFIGKNGKAYYIVSSLTASRDGNAGVSSYEMNPDGSRGNRTGFIQMSADGGNNYHPGWSQTEPSDQSAGLSSAHLDSFRLFAGSRGGRVAHSGALSRYSEPASMLQDADDPLHHHVSRRERALFQRGHILGLIGRDKGIYRGNFLNPAVLPTGRRGTGYESQNWYSGVIYNADSSEFKRLVEGWKSTYNPTKVAGVDYPELFAGFIEGRPGFENKNTLLEVLTDAGYEGADDHKETARKIRQFATMSRTSSHADLLNKLADGFDDDSYFTGDNGGLLTKPAPVTEDLFNRAPESPIPDTTTGRPAFTFAGPANVGVIDRTRTVAPSRRTENQNRSESWTDSPQVLAERFTSEQLANAVTAGMANGADGKTSPLDFGRLNGGVPNEEPVNTAAVYHALKHQGADADMIFAQAYDAARGDTKNVDALLLARTPVTNDAHPFDDRAEFLASLNLDPAEIERARAAYEASAGATTTQADGTTVVSQSGNFAPSDRLEARSEVVGNPSADNLGLTESNTPGASPLRQAGVAGLISNDPILEGGNISDATPFNGQHTPQMTNEDWLRDGVTDNPMFIARNFNRDALKNGYIGALANGQTTVKLKFASGEERDIDVRAIRDALQHQNIDTNELVRRELVGQSGIAVHDADPSVTAPINVAATSVVHTHSSIPGDDFSGPLASRQQVNLGGALHDIERYEDGNGNHVRTIIRDADGKVVSVIHARRNGVQVWDNPTDLGTDRNGGATLSYYPNATMEQAEHAHSLEKGWVDNLSTGNQSSSITGRLSDSPDMAVTAGSVLQRGYLNPISDRQRESLIRNLAERDGISDETRQRAEDILADPTAVTGQAGPVVSALKSLPLNDVGRANNPTTPVDVPPADPASVNSVSTPTISERSASTISQGERLHSNDGSFIGTVRSVNTDAMGTTHITTEDADGRLAVVSYPANTSAHVGPAVALTDADIARAGAVMARRRSNGNDVIRQVMEKYPDAQQIPNSDDLVIASKEHTDSAGRKFRYDTVVHRAPGERFYAYSRRVQIDADGNEIAGTHQSSNVEGGTHSAQALIKHIDSNLRGNGGPAQGILAPRHPGSWFTQSGMADEITHPATGLRIHPVLVGSNDRGAEFVGTTGIRKTGNGIKDSLIGYVANQIDRGVSTDDIINTLGRDANHILTHEQIRDLVERVSSAAETPGASSIAHLDRGGQNIVRPGDIVVHFNPVTGQNELNRVRHLIRRIDYNKSSGQYSYTDIAQLHRVDENGRQLPGRAGKPRPITTSNVTIQTRENGEAPDNIYTDTNGGGSPVSTTGRPVRDIVPAGSNAPRTPSETPATPATPASPNLNVGSTFNDAHADAMNSGDNPDFKLPVGVSSYVDSGNRLYFRDGTPNGAGYIYGNNDGTFTAVYNLPDGNRLVTQHASQTDAMKSFATRARDARRTSGVTPDATPATPATPAVSDAERRLRSDVSPVTTSTGKTFTVTHGTNKSTYYSPDGDESVSIEPMPNGGWTVSDPFSGDKDDFASLDEARVAARDLIQAHDDAGMYDQSPATTPVADATPVVAPVTPAPNTPTTPARPPRSTGAFTQDHANALNTGSDPALKMPDGYRASVSNDGHEFVAYRADGSFAAHMTHNSNGTVSLRLYKADGTIVRIGRFPNEDEGIKALAQVMRDDANPMRDGIKPFTSTSGKVFKPKLRGDTTTFYSDGGDEAVSVQRKADGTFDVVDPFSGDHTNYGTVDAANQAAHDMLQLHDDNDMYDQTADAVPDVTAPVTPDATPVIPDSGNADISDTPASHVNLGSTTGEGNYGLVPADYASEQPGGRVTKDADGNYHTEIFKNHQEILLGGNADETKKFASRADAINHLHDKINNPDQIGVDPTPIAGPVEMPDTHTQMVRGNVTVTSPSNGDQELPAGRVTYDPATDSYKAESFDTASGMMFGDQPSNTQTFPSREEAQNHINAHVSGADNPKDSASQEAQSGSNITETQRIASDVSDIRDLSHLTKIADATGSNTGGTYQDADGNKFYVKIQQSEAHANNEVLASALYERLGLSTVKVRKGRLADGTLVSFSPILDGSQTNAQQMLSNPDYLKNLQSGFAVDAWLANWDVAGANTQNIVTDADGNPVRVDNGGALLFRARGTAKGSAFGDSVGELDTLTNSGRNADAARIFGSMTAQQKKASAEKLLSISEQDIDELAHSAFGLTDQADELARTLKARRRDILSKFNIRETTPDAGDNTPTSTPATNNGVQGAHGRIDPSVSRSHREIYDTLVNNPDIVQTSSNGDLSIASHSALETAIRGAADAKGLPDVRMQFFGGGQSSRTIKEEFVNALTSGLSSHLTRLNEDRRAQADLANNPQNKALVDSVADHVAHAVPARVASVNLVESIIESGHIKTLFETGVSGGGSSSQDSRYRSEMAHFNLNPQAAPEEHPMFGILVDQRSIDDRANYGSGSTDRATRSIDSAFAVNGEGWQQASGMYARSGGGAALIVFKPHMRERATTTFANSLNAGCFGMPLNGDISVHDMAMAGLFKRNDSLGHNIISTNTSDVSAPRIFKYPEVQVHGLPPTVDDIDKIFVNSVAAQTKLRRKLAAQGYGHVQVEIMPSN